MKIRPGVLGRSWELTVPAVQGPVHGGDGSRALLRQGTGGVGLPSTWETSFLVPQQSPGLPRAKRAVLGGSTGKAVGPKSLPSQLPAVQSTLASGLSGSWSFAAHGDVQAEAGGVQVPGLSPQAGLGCGRQEEQLPALGRAARASGLPSARRKSERKQPPPSAQVHLGVQMKGVRGRRDGVELGLTEGLCLCRRRRGRRRTGSPGQLGEVVARRSGGMLAAVGFGVGSGEVPPSPFTFSC